MATLMRSQLTLTLYGAICLMCLEAQQRLPAALLDFLAERLHVHRCAGLVPGDGSHLAGVRSHFSRAYNNPNCQACSVIAILPENGRMVKMGCSAVTSCRQKMPDIAGQVLAHRSRDGLVQRSVSNLR